MSRPPAPATPSPRRLFVDKARGRSSTSKQASKQSAKALDESVGEQSASTQFARTPRFSFGNPRSALSTSRIDSGPRSKLVEALRASHRSIDVVEDPATRDKSDNEDDEMLDTPVPTVELLPASTTGPEAWQDDLPLSPKRRKLHGDNSAAQSIPTFKQSGIPAFREERQTPRFSHTETQSSQISTFEEPVTQRPVFLRPSVAPTESREPLPEAFSPHRRGQKFIAGGMAASVQQWVLETGQAAAQSRRSYLRGEDFVMRVKIDRTRGEGPFCVDGRLSNGNHVNLFLAGAGSVAPDRVLGVRSPVWNFQVEAREMTVAVDWRLVS